MKSKLSLFCIVLLTILISSCSKVDEKIESNVIFDSKSYVLSYGYLSDWGTNDALTDRQYRIELQSSELDASTYITFSIFSTATTELKTGTYTYTYINYGPGLFSDLTYGHDIVYDSKGVITSGVKFSDFSAIVLSGSKIVISKNGDNFQFDFSINVTDINGKAVAVTGRFSDVLISYDKK